MCFWQAWRERNNRERLGMVVSGKLSGAAADRRIDLHVELDPKQLLMRNTGDHQTGVDLYFVQRNARGETVAAEKQYFGMNG
jgi:hypothetical protein